MGHWNRFDGTADASPPRRAPERLQDALLLLGGGSRPRAAAFQAQARKHDPKLDLLWVIEDARGSILATALVVRSPGRLGNLHIQFDSGSPSLLPSVIDACLAGCRGSGLALLQSLAPPDSSVLLDGIRRSQMTPLARLAGLELEARSSEHAPPSWDQDCALVPTNTLPRSELELLIVSTFAGSQDCPLLIGMRRPEDILDGYLAVGVHDPQHWSVLMVGGVASGLVLVSDNPDAGVAELVYLGLRPEARGRGLGRRLAESAIDACLHTSSSTLVLACDEANPHALRIYETLGFSPVFRRFAFVFPLEGHSSTSCLHHD